MSGSRASKNGPNGPAGKATANAEAPDMPGRRAFLGGALALGMTGPSFAAPSAAALALRTVRIGVLSDFSSIYSTAGGKGLIVAVQLAIDDFRRLVPNAPFRIELVSADHQQKADVGANIAKRWYQRDGVELVLDVVNSAVAFAVANVARQEDKVVMFSGPGSARLTGDLCSPNTVHWTYDTYEVGNVLGSTITCQGGDSWAFITADYAFGREMEASATTAIRAYGGTVNGTFRHPVNTPDFSSLVLQAQATKAKVVAFANGGGDLVTAISQANEFGLGRKQRLAALNANVVDIAAIGLDAAQGITLAEPFYWNLNPATRAWTRRFVARYGGSFPTLHHAGVYAATLHFLRARATAPSTSGRGVVARMKTLKPVDPLFRNGRVRADGRVIHDIFVFTVKAPGRSRDPWDLYDLAAILPGDRAFRSMNAGNCPLVRPA